MPTADIETNFFLCVFEWFASMMLPHCLYLIYLNNQAFDNNLANSQLGYLAYYLTSNVFEKPILFTRLMDINDFAGKPLYEMLCFLTHVRYLFRFTKAISTCLLNDVNEHEALNSDIVKMQRMKKLCVSLVHPFLLALQVRALTNFLLLKRLLLLRRRNTCILCNSYGEHEFHFTQNFT